MIKPKRSNGPQFYLSECDSRRTAAKGGSEGLVDNRNSNMLKVLNGCGGTATHPNRELRLLGTGSDYFMHARPLPPQKGSKTLIFEALLDLIPSDATYSYLA